jgi:S-adenosylmethionine-diacylglycerol 3-amino-3-carboxypropyl transferase
MLRTLSRINRWFTGARGRGVFSCVDLASQRQYLETRFPHRRWQMVVKLLGNATVLNALLYRGTLPAKNVPGSTSAFYGRIFRSLFEDMPARESFFLQMIFLGELIAEEGLPLECDPAVFAAAKHALATCDVHLVNGDVFTAARSGPRYSFVSISDVPTFLPLQKQHGWLRELAPALSPGATVVTRGHLRVIDHDLAGFDLINDRHRALFAKERTHLWTIDVLRYRG